MNLCLNLYLYWARMKTYRIFLFVLCCFISSSIYAEKILNIYVWFGEVPDAVIKKFETDTGIKVNYTAYDSNETLYAKLKVSQKSGYDLIEPSSYYVDRMSQEGMLEKINKNKLSNYSNLDPLFLHTAYDRKSQFSIPYLWGITGIFVNQRYFSPQGLKSWKDLWNPRYKNQLMLLDDTREVFSMALVSLGYSSNDQNPEHIYAAYLKLKTLWPNIKLFNSNAIPSIPIDEDAVVGMAWSGDIYKAKQENSNIQFIFPQEGYVIWVDNFAIPKNAPHPELAYQFLNYILRGDIAAQATLTYGYPTANKASLKFLPKEVRENQTIFPPAPILKKGQFQKNVPDAILALYNHYWELLKMGGE
jgi:spermidine/putrescine transport system substrate-binding protein